jgi:hypothetical protein
MLPKNIDLKAPTLFTEELNNLKNSPLKMLPINKRIDGAHRKNDLTLMSLHGKSEDSKEGFLQIVWIHSSRLLYQQCVTGRQKNTPLHESKTQKTKTDYMLYVSEIHSSKDAFSPAQHAVGAPPDL